VNKTNPCPRWCLFLAVTVGALVPTAVFSQSSSDLSNAEIEVIHVQGNVYMLAGPGGNITVQSGDDGLMVVDTMFAEVSEKVLEAIRSIANTQIRLVVNTHVHPDHVGGNAAISEAGKQVVGGNFSRDLDFLGDAAPVIAHQNVLTDMSEADPAPPFELWPTSTYISPKKDLYFNGESIRIIHQPAAHTNGDSIVYFRRSDVISTGDIFNTVMYPYIDVKRGGTINGIIASLNEILDLAIPVKTTEGGTMIVPGHGRIADEFEVVQYRDMLTIIRDRIQSLIDKGMSLREIKRFRPTMGFDARWGADSGFWTTDQFVEAVYDELVAASSVR